MRVYWRKVRRGENLILSDENDGHEEELGWFRPTKRGISTRWRSLLSYDPSRSRKGFPSIAEAKDFVESIRPWELFGAQGVTVDPEVRPALDSATPFDWQEERMPIRKEMRQRYPKDWALRSRFVRFYRAGNRCEWCGSTTTASEINTGAVVVLTAAHVYDIAAGGLRAAQPVGGTLPAVSPPARR